MWILWGRDFFGVEILTGLAPHHDWSSQERRNWAFEKLQTSSRFGELGKLRSSQVKCDELLNCMNNMYRIDRKTAYIYTLQDLDMNGLHCLVYLQLFPKRTWGRGSLLNSKKMYIAWVPRTMVIKYFLHCSVEGNIIYLMMIASIQ